MISCRFPFVKHFFQVFSNFFQCLHPQGSFDLSSPNLVEPGRALSSAQLFYHSFFLLSSTFFGIFKFFFSTQTKFELVTCALSSAQLSYQRCHILSTVNSSKCLPIFCPVLHISMHNRNTGIYSKAIHHNVQALNMLNRSSSGALGHYIPNTSPYSHGDIDTQ